MCSVQRALCRVLKENGFFVCSTRSKTLHVAGLSADVVVCGGGITGTSIAYHLAQRGKKVVLFERDAVGSGGATAISTGLVTAPLHWQDPTKQYMAKRSLDLYQNLASVSSFRKFSSYNYRLACISFAFLGFHRCGRVYFARSIASEISLKRMFSRSVLYDEGAELIDDASEMTYRWPFLKTDDVSLALFSPNDLCLDSAALCRALAKRAEELGVEIREHCGIKEVIIGDNRVRSVDTDLGLVETESFVDASGIWCGHIPVRNLSTTTYRVAVYPAMYTYLVTQMLPSTSINDKTPIFTHVDEKIFIKSASSGTACGGFSEEQAKPLILPDEIRFDWSIPDADWDSFYPSLNKLLNRCKSLGSVEHGNLISGPEAYTPDKNPVVGEIPQIAGYYVAGGLSGQGLALAGGLGEALADVITDQKPKVDMSRMEVTRFIPLHSSPQYLFERVPEVAGMLFTNSYEYHQFHTARNLRTAPIFQLLKKKGAVFGEVMGYERPLWYTKRADRDNFYRGQDKLIGKPEWFDRVEKEYEACRERVGLIDMSNFSKFDIFGPDAVKLLQRICSANIDQPVGTTVYSGMQNQYGGYVTDCTLSRLSTNHYFIIAPTVQQLRLPRWVNKWINQWEYKVTCQDVTGIYTALDIVGPASRYLMQDLTGRPMTSSSFPPFSIKEMNIGIATGIRAISVTHCGELGYVIYIPSEVAQNVYERLVESGQEYSLRHVGYYALRQLRIEKFYVYWGQDISPLVTPIECGRAFRVDFKKDFIGRAALMKQLERGIYKRFIQVLIDSHDMETDPWPQGGEVIFRNGKPAGRTTSAAYGFTLACQVCIGYIENSEFVLTPEFITKGSYEIEIAGKRFPVRINLHSPTLPMTSSEHPIHYMPTQ